MPEPACILESTRSNQCVPLQEVASSASLDQMGTNCLVFKLSITLLLQAYGGVFPGSPPLDPNTYSKCYAMQLNGYVSVSSTKNIQTTSTNNDTYQFENQFRSGTPT